MRMSLKPIFKPVLFTFAFVAALSASTLLVAPASNAAADQYDTMRLKWREQLVGLNGIDTNAAPYSTIVTRVTNDATSNQSGMDRSGEPWNDLSDTSGANSRQLIEAYRRAYSMALAYATDGSSLQGNTQLLEDTTYVLDWLYSNRYNPSITQTAGNWWFWQIGIPIELNNVTTILYDELTPTQRSNYMSAIYGYSPSVSRTAANRVWSAQVVGLRGVLVKDSAKITEAANAVAQTIATVTSSDGFYADGSFIQHAYFSYTGGYGISMLKSLSELFFILKGSSWEITNSTTLAYYGYIASSYDRFFYKGIFMDSTRGREISRYESEDFVAGQKFFRGLSLLVESAPAAQEATLKASLKRMLLSMDTSSLYTNSSLSETRRVRLLLADSSVSPNAAPIGFKAYNSMDRAVAQQPNFAWNLSMYSTRTRNYEVISSENRKAWYTADGMTYLYTDADGQYSGNFWPTVNPYRLPGTTVDTVTKSASSGNQQPGTTTFVGSNSSASGKVGVSAMDLKAYGNNLTAKKSWFVFENEIVNLGNSITTTGQTGNGWDGTARHVETTIENRKTNAGSQTLTVDGNPVVSNASKLYVASPTWAHISNNTEGKGQIGYVLSGASDVRVARSNDKGSWNGLNINGTTTTYTNQYLSLWLNHGTNPANKSYAYTVLPGYSQTATSSYATNSDTKVLANSSAVTAVKKTSTNTVGAVFWGTSGGALNVSSTPFITTTNQAIVITEETDNGISVTIVDPSQKASGTLVVTINKAATSSNSVSSGVTINSLNTIKMTINVSGAKGKQFKANFTY